MIHKWKRMLVVVVGLLAIVISIVWLSGGFEKKIHIDDIQIVDPVTISDANRIAVEKKIGPAIEWVSGTLVSAKHTTVASRVLARVEEVYVRAGDDVSEGDILIKLDARDLQARVEQVQQELQAAETKRNLARTERDRNERLLRESAVSRERYDQSVATLRVAIAEVSRVKLSLEEAETALSHAVIKATVNGRVVDRLIEPGDTALPGAALLRIYDPTVLRVEVPVRESLAIHLKVGDALEVEIPATHKTIEGIIDEIVPFAEVGARTLLIKLRLPPDPQFIAGMFAKVALPAGEISYLVIPIQAIEQIGQLEFVNVITEKGKIERRLITTGEQINEGYIEVLSGLGKHEEILLPLGNL